MIFYLTSRIVGSLTAFLYPGYASYKTLSQRPASEADIERWLMYWSVLGCLISVEYVAEWLISWIPFYYLIKTLFLLYLSLPQTRGSSYIYLNHLQPFFELHESQIDAALASLKARVYVFVQERVRALWEHVSNSVGQQQSSPDSATTNMPAAVPPPSLGNPVSGPAQLAFSFWRSYGPAIIASGNAMLRQPDTGASRETPQSRPGLRETQSIIDRRRQLEAELAALESESLEATSSRPMPVPMPSSSSPTSRSAGSMDSEFRLRDRTTSVTGRFEEIDVPSDVEGYDVGGSEDVGHSYDARPVSQKRGSWFGWGGGSGSAGYERVKSD